MKLIIFLSILSITLSANAHIPIDPKLAYKVVSPLKPKETFEEWLKTDFTKMDKQQTTSQDIFVRCLKLTEGMVIDQRHSITQGIILKVDGDTLINPYGPNAKMGCVDAKAWANANPKACLLGKHLAQPLIQIDFAIAVGEKGKHEFVCATGNNNKVIVIETCLAGKMTHKDCEEIKSSNGEFCSTNWASQNVHPPNIDDFFFRIRSKLNYTCYKNGEEIPVQCNATGELTYLDKTDPWNSCGYHCLAKDFDGPFRLGDSHFVQKDDWLSFDHFCPPGKVFKVRGVMTCAKKFFTNSSCAPGCDKYPPPHEGVVYPPSCKNALNGDFCRYTCENKGRPSGEIECENQTWVGFPRCVPCCRKPPKIEHAIVSPSCSCTPEGEACEAVSCVENYQTNFLIPFCLGNEIWSDGAWCYELKNVAEVGFWNQNYVLIFVLSVTIGGISIVFVISIFIFARPRRNANAQARTDQAQSSSIQST